MVELVSTCLRIVVHVDSERSSSVDSTLWGSLRYTSIVGRPSASGLSRISSHATKASTKLITAGNQKATCQVLPKSVKPQATKRPESAPPTLCAVFQRETLDPRSLVENQFTSTRPEGGHPIPWKIPLKTIMAAMVDAIAAPYPAAAAPDPMYPAIASRTFAIPESTNPMGRNNRALERSEIIAVKNLLKP